MKVLLIGMTKNKGGTETFMMNTAKYLSDSVGAEIYFLDIYNGQLSRKEEIIKNGWNIIPYKIHIGLSGVYYNHREALSFFKQYKFDAVHVNTNILRNSFWAIAAKESGIKNVIVHSHNSSYGPRSKIRQFVYELIGVIDRYHLKRSNVKLLAASEEAGIWMFHGLPFTVIDNGIDTELYSYSKINRTQLRKELQISLESNVVISVARFAYQKNQEKIVNVFNKMLSSEPNLVLLLVGEGDDMNNIKNLVNNLGIGSKVRFLGRRDDVPKLLSVADIMLFPSRYEGTPYSLMEAESSGLPIVASSEAFRESENISGRLKLLSLTKTDEEWASEAILMLNEYRVESRAIANQMVKDSLYSLDNFKNQIYKLYSEN